MSPNGLGWIIVDSMDTMMVMNLTEPLAEVRKWLHRSLTYDQDQDVNTFETTIRMLGGLLSAHYLSTKLPEASSSRDQIYLSKSVDLADRLLAAYDSRSGIPYPSVHLGKRKGLSSHFERGASSMAEASTVQLEMKYLSYLTNNETYWRKAERVMKVLDDNAAKDGLLPIYIHPETGKFTTSEIRLGSRGDSYYGRAAYTPAHYGLLINRRIPYQAIPPDVRRRTGLSGNVGRGTGRDPETPYHNHQELKLEVCR